MTWETVSRSILPIKVRSQLASYWDAVELLGEMKDPRVMRALGPAGVRGLILKRGKQGTPTSMPAHHSAHFDWAYTRDQPAMADLYRRAKQLQWDGDADLPWHTDVDPLDPARAVIPDEFVDFSAFHRIGVKLDAKEERKVFHSVSAWMLSQFLHGEQGALFAAAQVTEAVQFFDGKLYGATQVMDEGRHVEVFHRYLTTKLEKLYQVNDNLFVIIDSLMTDSRWDMKFLGMQIMVEGLALGAFGVIYKKTKEPLLKELLKRVIQDEARHVHYGVLALREHITKELTESERREREDWSFEVALLMRNRFFMDEVYDEHFGALMSRAAWRRALHDSPGMQQFRSTMFSRLVPNLREVGLLRPRMRSRYEKAGLLQYASGKAADVLSGDQLVSELEKAA